MKNVTRDKEPIKAGCDTAAPPLLISNTKAPDEVISTRPALVSEMSWFYFGALCQIGVLHGFILKS